VSPDLNALAGAAADGDGGSRRTCVEEPLRLTRVVIDPAVIVGGLLRRRRSAALEVVELAITRTRVVGVISPPLLEQIFRLLSLPVIRRLAQPPMDDDLIDRIVSHLARRFEITPGVLEIEFPEGGPETPLVVAALEAGVDAIVSDDEGLATITVAGFRPLRVWGPGAFLRHGLGSPPLPR
jgi:hypothetical protein